VNDVIADHGLREFWRGRVGVNAFCHIDVPLRPATSGAIGAGLLKGWGVV
jgi:hypothetical protein